MPWSRICPRLDEKGVSLLASMLSYDPARRISAQDALCHDYFHDVPGFVPRLPATAGAVSVPPGSSPGIAGGPAFASGLEATAPLRFDA